MTLRRLFYDDEGDRTPLLWMLILLGCGLGGLLVLMVVFTACETMDREAAKNPLYRTPAWVQTCAQQRPLADCERDWQTLAGRRSTR